MTIFDAISFLFILLFIILIIIIYRLLFKIDNKFNNLNYNVNEVKEKVDDLAELNKRLNDSFIINNKIKKKCRDYLETFPTLSAELKLACQRGIEKGVDFFIEGYQKKNYSRNIERENIINLFKEIRTAVTFENVEIKYKDKAELELKVKLFKQNLKNALSLFAERILDNIEEYRDNKCKNDDEENINNFIEMAVKNINKLIAVTDNVYTKYC